MIIDDGSTDNTEEVVQDLLKDTEAGFKIRICKKRKQADYIQVTTKQLNQLKQS